jgi:hypothetical protein
VEDKHPIRAAYLHLGKELLRPFSATGHGIGHGPRPRMVIHRKRPRVSQRQQSGGRSIIAPTIALPPESPSQGQEDGEHYNKQDRETPPFHEGTKISELGLRARRRALSP